MKALPMASSHDSDEVTFGVMDRVPIEMLN